MSTPARSPTERSTPTLLILLAVVAALVVVPGGAFLVAANIGTGGKVAIGAAVVWWVVASTLIGLFVLRRRPELKRPVRGALLAASVASTVLLFLGTRDKVVDERIVTGAPTAVTPGSAPGPTTAPLPPPPQDVQLLSGSFGGASGHAGRGQAAVVKLADGARVLTFSDFNVDRGAGTLRVYLVAGDPQRDGAVSDFKDIAALKGNVGNQQYSIPADVDLARYSTVVVWCTPFTTRIAQAQLR